MAIGSGMDMGGRLREIPGGKLAPVGEPAPRLGGYRLARVRGESCGEDEAEPDPTDDAFCAANDRRSAEGSVAVP